MQGEPPLMKQADKLLINLALAGYIVLEVILGVYVIYLMVR